MSTVTTTTKILIILMIAAAMVLLYLFFGDMPFHNKRAKAKQTPPVFPTGIVINEMMSRNKDFYLDDNNKDSDWVELYNTTDDEISMQNYTLSDNADKLDKWSFPNVSIEAHGYLVIFMTGDTETDLEQGAIHCSFKLNSSGDSLFLVGSLGLVADSVSIPELPANVSYGRSDGQWEKFDRPTPGFENSDAGFSEFMKSNR